MSTLEELRHRLTHRGPLVTGREADKERKLNDWRARRDAELAEVEELVDVEQLTDKCWHHQPTGWLFYNVRDIAAATAKIRVDDGWQLVDRPKRSSAAATIAEWNEQRAAEQADADAQRAAHDRLLQRREPVTLARMRGVQLPTLAAAHRRLVDRQALIEVVDGRLRVELSPHSEATWNGLTKRWEPGLLSGLAVEATRAALEVLYAAEATVIDHLEHGTPLPDVQLDPYGRPVLPSAEGDRGSRRTARR